MELGFLAREPSRHAKPPLVHLAGVSLLILGHGRLAHHPWHSLFDDNHLSLDLADVCLFVHELRAETAGSGLQFAACKATVVVRCIVC